MAQAATNPKIEELRFKVKTDPKSRLFYPLAEELRKVSQFAEAEQVLRTGLITHPAYLSAWVSLGRVLRELQKPSEAVEALSKALQLDPGNVVAARLLADCYLTLGEKIEAIKKYKLVFALMPGDEEVEATIHRLETELAGPPAAAPEPPPPAAAPEVPPAPPLPEGDVFDVTYTRLRQERETESVTGDIEPMAAAHAESPFEEPAADKGYGSEAFAVEEPVGMHIASAPQAAEVPERVPPEPIPAESAPTASTEPTEEADVFAPAGSEIAPGFIQGAFEANVPPPPLEESDFAKTLTMADLYANQGLLDEARDIYEDILARDPSNATVRQKLEALGQAAPSPDTAAPAAIRNPKIERLESWLAKVKRV